MKRILLFCTAFVCSLSPSLRLSTLSAENITVDQKSRNYIVYAPKNLGENRPLLISCHGMNQDAGYQKGMLQVESIADTAKFVTVFPNGIDKGWDIGGDRDVRFVEALIDKMVAQYKIDRKRVYLSGFSMGGMFTYHCMNRIADKIAAFAPISGYPLGGATTNASRPIPIIHTQGLADDVCQPGPVPGIMAQWARFNHCSATPQVIKRYRGIGIATLSVWSGGDNGVEVRLLQLEGKGHWISNDGFKTADVIWNFCKNYSLDLKDPSVHITTPKDGLSYLTFGGTTEMPAIPLSATASDPDGKIAKIAFYDGSRLLSEQETDGGATYTLDGLSVGIHTIKAVATDDEGRTAASTITISINEPTGSYVFTKVFQTEGSVPVGWSTYDGKERRTGYSDGYSSGCRVFHFTNANRGFDYGLYVRNVDGKARQGYARFAGKESPVTLTLYPGRYTLIHQLSNWNIPTFSPITIAVETSDGREVAASEFTPAANVGNNASNAFSGVKTVSFDFEVAEKGRYQITFYTADAAWSDLVVGRSSIKRVGDVTGISEPCREPTVGNQSSTEYYDLCGRPVKGKPGKGVYILNGKKIMVR